MSSQAELIAWGSSLLSTLEGDEGGATPVAEARYLLTWALGVDSLLFAPREVPPANEAAYRAAVTQRALRHPRSHVTGEMHFRGLVLSGGKGVFTVRPETEMLVEHVVELMRSGALPDGEWVDLCTGSAAIALALSIETGHQVTAVEIDSDAFAYAERNLARYPKAQIRLVKGDATATDTLSELNGKTSLVVTNPPYVPAQEAPTQIEAQQDPARALYGGGDDGTEIPRRIIERSRELLVSGGMLAMEHSPSQAQTLREVAVMNGFTQVHTRSDLSGVERFLIAWKTQRKLFTVEQIFDCSHGWAKDELDLLKGQIGEGALVVLPTDTVYGIGVSADDHQGVRRLLAAKGRGETMPPPVLVASVEQARSVSIDLDNDAIGLMKAFWPGALTLIVRANPSVNWDLGKTHGTVALRMPNHAQVCELLEAVGPMAVTSANLTGEPPATNIDEALGYFRGTVDYYVNSGPTQSAQPSTIIDCAHGQARVLREGALSVEDIARVLDYQPLAR